MSFSTSTDNTMITTPACWDFTPLAVWFKSDLLWLLARFLFLLSRTSWPLVWLPCSSTVACSNSTSTYTVCLKILYPVRVFYFFTTCESRNHTSKVSESLMIVWSKKILIVTWSHGIHASPERRVSYHISSIRFNKCIWGLSIFARTFCLQS